MEDREENARKRAWRTVFGETEPSLELCFRMVEDMSTIPKWLFVSVAFIEPTLKKLETLNPTPNLKHDEPHRHDLTFSRDLNILKHRFPCIDRDHVKGPFPSPEPQFSHFSSALIGSTVYCVGGDGPGWDDDHDWGADYDCLPADQPTYLGDVYFTNLKGRMCYNVMCCDFADPKPTWKEGGALVSPRLCPVLVPFKGMLYAFSGNHPSHLFAEVYDPVSGTWTGLPPPPPPFAHIGSSQIHVACLPAHDKLWLIIICRGVGYTFDILTQKWEQIYIDYQPFDIFSSCNPIVSVDTPNNRDTVLYWINSGIHDHGIFAYDLYTGQLYHGIVPGDSSPPRWEFGDLSYLFHLRRDLFCAAGRDRLLLHVLIIRITLKTPNTLEANVLACFAISHDDTFKVENAYLLYEAPDVKRKQPKHQNYYRQPRQGHGDSYGQGRGHRHGRGRGDSGQGWGETYEDYGGYSPYLTSDRGVERGWGYQNDGDYRGGRGGYLGGMDYYPGSGGDYLGGRDYQGGRGYHGGMDYYPRSGGDYQGGRGYQGGMDYYPGSRDDCQGGRGYQGARGGGQGYGRGHW